MRVLHIDLFKTLIACWLLSFGAGEKGLTIHEFAGLFSPRAPLIYGSYHFQDRLIGTYVSLPFAANAVNLNSFGLVYVRVI